MESLANTVKVTLPNYLQSLPIPGSLEDVGKLTVSDWLSLGPFTCAVVLVTYTLGQSARNLVFGSNAQCNPGIKKNEAKVTDVLIKEELPDKISLCRCWRSAKWPYCDGAHKHHNKATGDNVGAVVIRSKDWQPKPEDKGGQEELGKVDMLGY